MNIRTRHSRTSKSHGFALVIALSLMGFVLVLLLILTSITRVETINSSNRERLLLAQQNALLGLEIALGELQVSAGSDTVATGTLAVDASLNSDDSKHYWTGVWENQGSHDTTRNLSTYQPALLKVLVSGEGVETTLSEATNNSWPTLVGTESVEDVLQKVQAPAVDILSDQPTSINRYAYWIGDEGVKATVNISDALENTLSDERRLLTMPKSGAQLMQANVNAGDTTIGEDFPTNSATLDRLISNESLDISMDSSLFRKTHFHDLTMHSQGVLSDQRIGGLRQDLTWMLRNNLLPENYLYQEPVTLLERSSIVGPAWSLLQDFYKHSVELKDTGQVLPNQSLRQIDDATNHQSSIGPIPTQIKLYFNFSFTAENVGVDGGNLRMHIFPVIVLMNPYNAPLAPENYILRFRQHNSGAATELLVDVDVETTTGPETIRFPLSPASGADGYLFKDDGIFGDSNGGDGDIYFHASELSFAPGEIKVLTLKQTSFYKGPLNTNITTHNSSDFTGNELVEGFDDSKSAIVQFKDTLPIGATPNFYEFQLLKSGIIRFASSIQDANIYSHLNYYDGITYTKSSPISATAEQGNSLTIFPKAGFSYKIETDNLRYLSNFNIRSTLVMANGYDWEGPPEPFKGNFGLSDYTTDTTDTTSGKGYFGNGHGSSAQSNITLFDIPKDPNHFISLGQLQHLDLSIRFASPSQRYDETNAVAPTHVFGNSAGSPNVLRTSTYYEDSTLVWWYMKANFDESYRANEALWDHYFFSSLDTTPGASTADNPQNQRLLLQAPLTSVGNDSLAAAKNMLIQGAFNVNSSSVDAWRALLAGLNDHSLKKYDGSLQTNLSYLFPRFTNPIGGGFDSNTATSASNEAWNGARALTEDEIIDLASEIVQEVKARGPFLSLADFVNRDLVPEGSANSYQAYSGALQRAIDNSNLNSNFRGNTITTTERSDRYPEPDFFQGHQFDSAPGTLTQADLLTPIAPIISARSDTFRIRAYGESQNSVAGQTAAKAWLEAIVQRIPDKVSTTENIETAASSNTFGRRFEIVSIKWLTPQN